jgi:integrase
MGSVFRKTFTKPLPAAAELFRRDGEQWARWKDSKGKKRTAKTTVSKSGAVRITIKAATYTACYRDGQNAVREVSTGCSEREAAQSVLNELVRRAELVKAKVLTPIEDAIADYQAIPLKEHFAKYLDSLRIKSVSAMRMDNMESQFERLCRECRFTYLADLRADLLVSWLKEQQIAGMSAATRNGYRETLVMFCNWCAAGSSPRLTSNPFKIVPKADVKADPRRKRRSMTEAELIRLLEVARRRPLEEARTIRRGKRKGQQAANLDSLTVEKLERLGRERALIYKTLVLTGLRKGELASLTVGQLHLDHNPPYAELLAGDEKNREGSSIPLRSDLADDLRNWIANRQATTVATIKMGQTSPRELANSPLFTVPDGLVKILDRDLAMAGIAKRDDRGRSLDVHALRTSFGTLLSVGGVAPKVAQIAMRHSDIGLTMQTYTDTRLFDLHGALDALPALPLNTPDRPDHNTMKATGTDGEAVDQLAVPLAVGPADRCKTLPISAQIDDGDSSASEGDSGHENLEKAHEKRPLTVIANDLLRVGATGFEPATSTSRTQRFLSAFECVRCRNALQFSYLAQ